MIRCYCLVLFTVFCCPVSSQPSSQDNVKDLSVLVNNLGTSVSDVITAILNKQLSSGDFNLASSTPSLANQLSSGVEDVILQYSNVINFEGIDLGAMIDSVTLAINNALVQTTQDPTQDAEALVKQITNEVLKNIGQALVSATGPILTSASTPTTPTPTPASQQTPQQAVATSTSIAIQQASEDSASSGPTTVLTQQTPQNGGAASSNLIKAIQENKIAEVVQALKSIQNEGTLVQSALKQIVCTSQQTISVEQVAETLQAMISSEMIDLVAQMMLNITQSGNYCNLPQIIYNWLLSDEALVRVQLSLPIGDIIAAEGCDSIIFKLIDEVRSIATSNGNAEKIEEEIETIMPEVVECSATSQTTDEESQTPTSTSSYTTSAEPLPFQITSGLPIPTIPPLDSLQQNNQKQDTVQSQTETTASPPQKPIQQPTTPTVAKQPSFVWSSEGKRIMVGGCFDIPTPGEYSCAEEAELGKCDRDWMVEGMLCAKTCGVCDKQCIDIQPNEQQSCEQEAQNGMCDSQLFKEQGFCKKTCGNCGQSSTAPVLTPIPTQSNPVLPASNSNSPKLEFKVPESPVGQMISVDSQRAQSDQQANNIVQQGAASQKSCTDIPPDDEFTCTQQKEMDKCDRAWMLAENYCQITCGRCEDVQVENAQYQQGMDNQSVEAIVSEITSQISKDATICSNSEELSSIVDKAVRSVMASS